MRDEILRALKRAQPTRVRATDAAGEVRVIAVPTRRTRWPWVLDTIDAAPWCKLELLNAKGELLAVVEAPDEAPSTSAAGGAAAAQPNDERLLALLLRGQEAALKWRDQETATLLKAVGDVVRAQTDALRSLQAVYQAQVDAAADVASMRAQVEAQGDGDVGELLKALPQLLPLLGALKRGALPTPAPAPAVPT